MKARERTSLLGVKVSRAKASRKSVKLKPGTCYCCGCTNEFGCDAGCDWVEATTTLCSQCYRIGDSYLAWRKLLLP